MSAAHCPQLNRSMPRSRTHGFTLIELMVSIAIASLVAAGVVSFMLTLRRGVESGLEVRDQVSDREVMHIRLAPILRDSICVLASDEAWILLWKSDVDMDGLVSMPELQLILYSGANERLETYSIADQNAEWDTISFDADFSSIASALELHSDATRKQLASGIDECIFAFPPDDPTGARSVLVSLMSNGLEAQIYERFRVDAP